MHELANKYKYIIFDFDGTINDTSPGIYATFKKVLSHFGVDYSDVDLSRHIGPPLEYTYEHLVGKQNMDEAIKLHYKVFADDNAAQNSHLYDGIKQTIAALKNHGYVIAIASSKYEPQLQNRSASPTYRRPQLGQKQMPYDRRHLLRRGRRGGKQGGFSCRKLRLRAYGRTAEG